MFPLSWLNKVNYYLLNTTAPQKTGDPGIKPETNSLNLSFPAEDNKQAIAQFLCFLLWQAAQT